MQNKDEIIKRLLANTAEIITPEEFEQRISGDKKFTHYIGFEISGYVHIGQGIMSALVIKDLLDLGVECTIWLADWHTWINGKLDGRKKTAQIIARGYFTEAIKACLTAVGAEPSKVKFRLASEWYEKDAMGYWEIVRQVMQNTTLSRLLRSIDIMGREAKENVDSDKLLYPAMQVADILYQGIDIAHAGMDQRKAHVIMRDVASKIMPGKPKPIAIHHPLLMGLTGLNSSSETELRAEIREQSGAVRDLGPAIIEETPGGKLQIKLKMSKSKPDSAIFVHDSESEIERKLSKAFCAEKNIENNPVLNWAEHLLFWNRQKPFVIDRKPEHGGQVAFATYKELEGAFSKGEVHPMDLKAAVAKELIELLAPVREHFAKPTHAAQKEELDKVLENK